MGTRTARVATALPTTRKRMAPPRTRAPRSNASAASAAAPTRQMRGSDLMFLLMCIGICTFMVYYEMSRRHKLEMAQLGRMMHEMSQTMTDAPAVFVDEHMTIPQHLRPPITEAPTAEATPAPTPACSAFGFDILDPHRTRLAIKSADTFFENLMAPVQHSRGHAQFDMMGPAMNPCLYLSTFGIDDEAKNFCLASNATDARVAPVNASASEFPCVVHSLGSKNEFRFEQDMARRTPCYFHVWDCTVAKFTPPPELLGRSKMHKLCVGDPRHQDFMSLPQVMGITESKRVDFLKMDIEGSEWWALRNLLDTAARIRNDTGRDDFLPAQMAVEVHTFHGQTNQQLFCLMSSLYREGGYVLATRRNNRRCPGCAEFLFVRVRCGPSLGRHASCNSTMF